MQAISNNTNLVSGHSWLELKDMIDEQVQKTHIQIYAVEELLLTPIPPVKFSHLITSEDFKPNKARQESMRLLEVHQPAPNPNGGQVTDFWSTNWTRIRHCGNALLQHNLFDHAGSHLSHEGNSVHTSLWFIN